MTTKRKRETKTQLTTSFKRPKRADVFEEISKDIYANKNPIDLTPDAQLNLSLNMFHEATYRKLQKSKQTNLLLKIGDAAVTLGPHHKVTQEAIQRARKPLQDASIEILAKLLREYSKALKDFDKTLNLPWCLICNIIDDTIIYDKTDMEPRRFFKFSELPHGCSCNIRICRPCLCKMIKTTYSGNLALQCPSCRKKFEFGVVTIQMEDKDICLHKQNFEKQNLDSPFSLNN